MRQMKQDDQQATGHLDQGLPIDRVTVLGFVTRLCNQNPPRAGSLNSFVSSARYIRSWQAFGGDL
jgi:hypothetical protein